MIAIYWFESNYMKLNQDESHFLLSGHIHKMIWASIEKIKVWENRGQKLLGIIIDRNLDFDEHILSQCKKPGRKLGALTRIYKFMSLERHRTLKIYRRLSTILKTSIKVYEVIFLYLKIYIF